MYVVYPNDWAGTCRNRQPRKGCAVGGPTTVSYYFIPARTRCLVKKVGDPKFRPYETTADHEFVDPKYTTAACYVFFAAGWLLCVDKRYVQSKSRLATREPNLRSSLTDQTVTSSVDQG